MLFRLHTIPYTHHPSTRPLSQHRATKQPQQRGKATSNTLRHISSALNNRSQVRTVGHTTKSSLLTLSRPNRRKTRLGFTLSSTVSLATITVRPRQLCKITSLSNWGYISVCISRQPAQYTTASNAFHYHLR